MTANPERTPSSRPLSPDELSIETSLLIDQDNRGIDELETFVMFRTLLIKKIELLANGDSSQEDADACDILLVTVSKHFARTVQTESTAEARAEYAIELLMQTLAELNELCRQRSQAITGPPAEELSKVATEQLYQEIATKNPQEEFATLETLYGASYTSVVNRII